MLCWKSDWKNSNQVKRETNKAMKSFFSLGLKPITSNVRLTTLVARLKRAAKMRVRSRGQPTNNNNNNNSKHEQGQHNARILPSGARAQNKLLLGSKKQRQQSDSILSQRERDSNREKESDSETERAQQQKAQSF